MANNVEIEVSGRDGTGGLFDRVRSQARSASSAVTSAFNKASESTKENRRQLHSLSDEIKKAASEYDKLRKEFARTGDKDIEIKLKAADKDLKTLTSRFRTLGQESASKFSLEFSSRLGPLLARAPLSPHLIAAVAAASPIITTMVGFAISAGAAAGAVGIGTAIVAQRPEVQKAAGDMGEAVFRAIKADASPMVKPVLAGIQMIEDRADKLRPAFRRIFSSAGQFAPTLFRAAADSIDLVVEGFADIVENGDPIVDLLGREIPRTVGVVVDGLKDLSEESNNIAAAMGNFFAFLNFGIKTTMTTLSLMNKALPFTSPLVLGLGDAMSKSGDDAEEGSFDLQKFLESLGDTGEEAKKASAEVRTLDQILDDFADKAISAFEAETRFNEVLDQSTKKAIEAGKGIDANTKAGRGNRDTLLALAQATRDSSEALAGMAGGQEKANEIMQRGYARFIRLATSAGMSADAARELATELGLIPPSTDPKVKVHGGPGARAEAQRVENKLEAMERTYRPRIVVSYEGLLPSFAGEYRSAQRPYAAGGNVAAAATGGARGAMVRVGEQGEEIVRLPYGSSVMTAGDSARFDRQQASAGWGGGPMAMTIEARPGSSERLIDELVEGLRFRIWRSGGDAQRYLGRRDG